MKHIKAKCSYKQRSEEQISIRNALAKYEVSALSGAVEYFF